MVSVGVPGPREPHLTSQCHCFILSKAGVECLSWKGHNAAIGVDCLMVLGCLFDFFKKSLQVLVEKHLQLALSK